MLQRHDRVLRYDIERLVAALFRRPQRWAATSLTCSISLTLGESAKKPLYCRIVCTRIRVSGVRVRLILCFGCMAAFQKPRGDSRLFESP